MKYEASVSPSALSHSSFHSVKGMSVTAVDVNNLVDDNSAVPNVANQEIFKNLSLAWWVEGLNAGTIQYRPVSNEVNWAFVNSSGKDVNIAIEITDIIIPNRTANMIRDAETKTMRCIMQDNRCLIMTTINNMFF